MSGPAVADVADVIRATIEEQAPAKVDREAVTVTGEGPAVAIIVVPHRDLKGIALVVWADEHSIDLLWAQIGDLSTHDDIDQGIDTGTVAWGEDWKDRLRSVVEAELVRTITLKRRSTVFGKGVVECWINIAGADKRVGVVRPKTLTRNLYGRALHWETALAAGGQLPFSEPPPVAVWRRNA